MTASYVSVRFEKTNVSPVRPPYRCIVRNLDDGGVPPTPGPGHRPTTPDTLRECCTIEYVNDTLGERMVRAATLADLALDVRTLNSFEDAAADFVAAGVQPGDALTITLPQPSLWASEEYPGAPFTFYVASVVSATRLVLQGILPCFAAGLAWNIPGRTSGITGYPRRDGFPSPGALFRDSRMAMFYNDVASLDAFVEATKSQCDSLAQDSTISNLTSENYTSEAL